MKRSKTEAVRALFPSLVYQKSLGAAAAKFNKELQIEAKQIQRVDTAGVKWSAKNYPYGYTSYGSMDQLHRFSSTFQELEYKLDQHVQAFARSLDLDIGPGELAMSSCWVNVMAKQAQHSMHLHPLSVISGTYYVSIPKGSSGLKFEDPRMGYFMASPPRKNPCQERNERFITLTPNAGDVVLFESWMKHEVPPQKSAGERISISFNYDWVNG